MNLLTMLNDDEWRALEDRLFAIIERVFAKHDILSTTSLTECPQCHVPLTVCAKCGWIWFNTK